MYKKVLSHTVVRYCLVGGLSYAIELSTLFGLYFGLHVQRTIATAIAFWVGLFISFILLKLLAFHDYQKEIRAIGKQSAQYGVLVGINYTFTLLIVSLFSNHYLLYSRTLALLITTLWNYFFYKKIIFRRDGPS